MHPANHPLPLVDLICTSPAGRRRDTMSRVEIEAYLGQLTRDGVLLADAAERAGLEAGVPGCPAWQVRDLLRHQAYVHAWAARHVRDRLPKLDGEASEAD